jgi:hypothetical protein
LWSLRHLALVVATMLDHGPRGEPHAAPAKLQKSVSLRSAKLSLGTALE